MAVARFDALRTLAFGGISGTYAAVGTPMTQNWREFRLLNNTDGDMVFSADGMTDNFYLPAYTFLLWDLATNAPPVNTIDDFVISIGTQFYVKSATSPSMGSVYIEGIYARRI